MNAEGSSTDYLGSPCGSALCVAMRSLLPLSGGCRGARSPTLLVLLCVPCESSGVVFWVGVYLAGRVLVWL